MRVAVAMSGGMDSTACALILKELGHEIVGLHMLLHSGSERSWEAARHAAVQIGVELDSVDLITPFRELIIDLFVAAYARGLTPSPCPRCNRLIKMGLLWEKARYLGCDKIVTGHYARLIETGSRVALARGFDSAKDQSYFLALLSPEILKHAIFPLGGMKKEEVREFLRRRGITVWQSEESQELCFVPRGDYREFLEREGVTCAPGPIIDTTGRVLGHHRGVTAYTVGQRRGLGICSPEPLYVIRIDAADRSVVVGPRRETYIRAVRLAEVNFLEPDLVQKGERLRVKVRSTSRPVGCRIVDVGPESLALELDEPQSGVAPGQAGVLYHEDCVVAGGWIEGTESETS